MKRRKSTLWIATALVALALASVCVAVEPDMFRLLSLATTSKLILVSQIPNKVKYLLDASTAKITVDGKPAEFQNLQAYTIVQIKFELRKGSKDGVDLDGVATEIKVTTPQGKT